MTLDQPAAVSEDPGVTPGYCSIHTNQRLVTHRAAGLRAYGTTVATVCPDPSHGYLDRERCRWCGGPLIQPTERRSSVSPRREYCSALHRLHAHRARPKP